MTLFGKDVDGLQVMAADFLPDGKRLYILVADDDCNIHVLQYDPEGEQGLLRIPVIFFVS
jgi:cleavage and polyadenylation specificity factor subunit 1